jgi:hypothetical protein
MNIERICLLGIFQLSEHFFSFHLSLSFFFSSSKCIKLTEQGRQQLGDPIRRTATLRLLAPHSSCDEYVSNECTHLSSGQERCAIADTISENLLKKRVKDYPTADHSSRP